MTLNLIKQYQIGDLIGGEYLIHKVLGGEGKSGMGVVYVVTKYDLPEPRILKTLQCDPSEESSLANQRFLREAEVWINLGSHPNIVQAKATVIIDGRMYILAEYIYPDERGRNCVTQYISEAAQPLSQIIKWGIQFCDGMIFALSKGLVVHRDIKPDNLLITASGDLKITDFGLAKIGSLPDTYHEKTNGQMVSADKKSQLTQTGALVGTLLYIAPELLKRETQIDFRADMYAFGIVLYSLITGGEYPYKLNLCSPKVVMELVNAHLSDKVHKINSPLFTIIKKCLEKKPDHRYKSYEELAFDLQQLAQKEGIAPIQRNREALDLAADLFAKIMHSEGIGELDQAETQVKHYLNQYPYNYNGWTALGTILLKKDKYEDSISATLRSIKLWSGNTHAWNNLGVAYMKLNDWEKASDAFRKAIFWDENNTGAMMQLAFVLYQLGFFSKSKELLLRALDISPSKNTLLINAAKMARLLIKKSPDDAVELLTRLTSLDPKNIDNWGILAYVYDTTGKLEKAIECLKTIESIDPNDIDSIHYILELLGKLGRIPEAIIYCDKLMNFPSQKDTALINKVQLLLDIEMDNEAKTIVQNELRIKPESYNNFYELIIYYYKHVDYKKVLILITFCLEEMLKNPGLFNEDQTEKLIDLSFRTVLMAKKDH